MKRTLQYKDDKSDKFWTIETKGSRFTVTFGKTGTTGQTQTKDFSTASACNKEAEKQIASKLKKGYVEIESSEDIGPEKPDKNLSYLQYYFNREEIPADIADDGTEKPWDKGNYTSYYWDDYSEFPDLKEPEVIEDKYVCNDIITDDPQIDESQEDRFETLSDEMVDAADEQEYDKVKEYWEEMKSITSDKFKLKDPLQRSFLYLFDRFRKINEGELDMLQYLIKEGATIKPFYDKIGKQSYYMNTYSLNYTHPLMIKFADKYMLDPDPSKVEKILQETLNEIFKSLSEKSVQIYRDLIKKIKNNKDKKSKLPIGKLSSDIEGFRLTWDHERVGTYPTIYSNLPWIEIECAEARDFKLSSLNKYALPILKPMLQKMIDDGEFEPILHDGYFCIRFYDDDEGIIAERLPNRDQIKAEKEKLEEQLHSLEISEDWDRNAEIIKETISLYMKGTLTVPDTDRALNIILRHMYSGNEDSEEKAIKLLYEYEKCDLKKWWFEQLIYNWNNFEFESAQRNMNALYKAYKYEPAYVKLIEWNAFEDQKEEENDISIEDNEDINSIEKFKKVFTEDDLFVETDTIIARAYSNKYVYIKFKIEGEKGYSDSLDFLNNLLKKGYSKILDGYALQVHFIDEPQFLIVDWPLNYAHAFFTKAVMYESLHNKIREYIEYGMCMFDGYEDLEGAESCTVVGTFAAGALALCDKKHLDMAIELAENTDGEHEELTKKLTGYVIERHGINPETIPAIVALALSYDHYVEELPEEIYTNTVNLQAILDCSLEEWAFRRLVNGMFSEEEEKVVLKKIKKLFEKAKSDKDKKVYADFYNRYKGIVEEEDDDLNLGNDLSVKVKNDTDQSIIMDRLPENPPCIIDKAEAEKRGIDLDELDVIDKACGLVFFSTLITNPYIYDYMFENIDKRRQIKLSTYTCWSPDCLRFGKSWIVDFRGAPYQYGVLLYDGKNKPVILYGIMDYAEIILKMNKRSLKDVTSEDLEDMKQQYLQMECPKGSPVVKKTPSTKYLDNAFGAYYEDKYMRALINLDKITKDDGENYIASLLIRAKVMKAKKDVEALNKIYNELKKLLPQYTEYWNNKMA